MKLSMRALSDEDIRRVHEKTVQILEEAGVQVKSKRARKALLDAGATAGEGDAIKIPEALVFKCLETAPKSFVLGARNPTYDIKMPADRPGHSVDGTATEIVDLETGKPRPSTKADIVNIGRVFQVMETGTATSNGCSALDVPPETHYIHEFAAALQGSSKHIDVDFGHTDQVPYVIEILRAVLGSDEAIRERKILSLTYCPISPLAHNDDMLDAYLELAEYDVPICPYPCPIVGLTSPASVFTSLCQINAETLSSLVIFQLVKPGLPIIYGTCSGSTDRVTGDYVDGEESVLLSMGGVEMARYYGLPSGVSGGDMSGWPTYLTGPDSIDGFGTTNDAMISDLEEMVIQDEMAKRVYRIMDGIDTSDEKDLTQDLINRKPNGSFLSCKSTRRMMREGKELYFSKLFSDEIRNTGDENEAMWEIAHQYVKDILAGPFIDELPKETQKKIDEICAKADRELAGIR